MALSRGESSRSPTKRNINTAAASNVPSTAAGVTGGSDPGAGPKDKGRDDGRGADGDDVGPKRLPTSPSGSNAAVESSTRKVRTVPPSAQYDPPTPPPLPHPSIPPSAQAGPSTSATRHDAKRIRSFRRRYSTSEDSLDDSTDYDSTDDEPPWWTFTTRGMAKMKSRATRNAMPAPGGLDSGERQSSKDTTGVERSAKKSKEKRDIWGGAARRRRKNSDVALGPAISSSKRASMVDSDIPAPSPGSMLDSARTNPSSLPQSPHEHPSHPHGASNFFRRSYWRDSPRSFTPEPVRPMAMQRSTSAPSSPIRARGHAGFTSENEMVSTAAGQGIGAGRVSGQFDSDEPRGSEDPILEGGAMRQSSDPTYRQPLPGQGQGQRRRPFQARRQSTTPYFPKLRKRANLSDLPSDAESPSPSDIDPMRLGGNKSKKSVQSLGGRPRKFRDTEATGGGSDDSKTKVSRGKYTEVGAADNAPTPASTSGGGPAQISLAPPSRPKTSRRASNKMMRIQLPPPITDHFKHGWPLAGSWQDAYYGIYPESERVKLEGSDEVQDSRAASRKSSAGGMRPRSVIGTPAEDQRLAALSTPLGGDSAGGVRGRSGNGATQPQRSHSLDESGRPQGTPRGGEDDDGPKTPMIPPPAMKRSDKSQRRSKRRRYRTALQPPTPRGLGFTPRGVARDGGPDGTAGDDGAWKEGRVDVDGNGFDWGNGNPNGTANDASGNKNVRLDSVNEDGHPDRPPAEKEKDHVNGNGNGNGNEGSASTPSPRSKDASSSWSNGMGSRPKSKKKWGIIRRRLATRKERRKNRVKEYDWKKRYKRMLFLDARVTIWIRLINLAVVIAALALAVTIRLKLEAARVPGLMGSSTTIIMSYSSLTSLHVLTAIYREYFGRPIGLWGLRSKMLWICLDLLFIALWSSAISDAANDYIATPLNCTEGKAWWNEEIDLDLVSLAPGSGSGSGSIIVPRGRSEESQYLDRLGLGGGGGGGSGSVRSKVLETILPYAFTQSSPIQEICQRQVGCMVLCLLALILYCGNMVLSLFRIFETVRRTAGVDRAVMV